MDKPLHIAFLWHMHQPYYKDNLTREVSLPWVRLHGIKDYLDMAQILEDFPHIHQTFNLVPSLLEQIREYTQNNGLEDKFFVISRKKSSQLKEEEKAFIILNFFMANWETMVKPYPRYYDLLIKRGELVAPAQISQIIKHFKEQDFLDLQVWFNLSWFDPIYKEKDAALKNLIQKGAYFSEEEKNIVLDKQLEILKQIIPYYKQAQDHGQIEITTSPYYHPILPLLCNQEVALEALPGLKLPKAKFKYPQDAQRQLEMAIENYQTNFGRKPRGLWPPEGAVSEGMLPLLIKNGLNWIATDEEALFRSIGKTRTEQLLYRPYSLKRPEGNLNIIFRDRTLSNLIGFVYANWPAAAAIEDFIKRLYEIKERLKSAQENYLISIILDGENAWEYYPNDGRDFLLGLYQKLNEDKNFKLVTVSEFLMEFPAQDNIERLFAGSWINSNFAIWIGHPEKNTAWDYLTYARQDLVEFEQKNPEKKKETSLKAAWQEIYIAQGSDWNWWYGPDHSSGGDEEFDRLFRKHLANVYTLIDQKIPDYLQQPIKVKGLIARVEPSALIKPTIDGRDTNYYEWLTAGHLDLARGGGTMHQSQNIISRIWYGFDLQNIYLRVDFNPRFSHGPSREDLLLVFDFVSLNLKLEIPLFAAKITGRLLAKDIKGNWQAVKEITSLSFDKILEIALGYSELKIKPKDKLDFFMTLESQGVSLERCPVRDLIRTKVPTSDYESSTWSA